MKFLRNVNSDIKVSPKFPILSFNDISTIFPAQKHSKHKTSIKH